MDSDPHDRARELYRENLWLRQLVSAAAELERLAAYRTRDAGRLLYRAQKLRRDLHQGPPASPFYPPPVSGTGL